ncbi:MAG TPA: serine hydrolase domain-containing protein [Micromonosporaceae bacterium]|jgi:CubicO group peptidase (beta-lactamase class C family)
MTARLLRRTSPAAEGLDPAAVRRLVAAFDDLHAIHSFVLVRHGAIVAEGSWSPHTADRPHAMYSVSKSFTATAVGLAIDEGLFGLDDRLVDLLAADAPTQPPANLAAIRVRDLLTMTAGHAADTLPAARASKSNWLRLVLEQPVAHEPGTRFVYNSGATYLLGAIVQRLSGQRLLDYLRPRVLDPLGITSATWEQDPEGLDVAGYGLSITVEELAAFGQLYLQRGQWRGRQLVPAAWVDAATSYQMASNLNDAPDWEQGYGYQFWLSRPGGYRADGAYGQFAIVLPEHDIVLATTGGIQKLQTVLDAVWASLLPSLTAGSATEDAATAAVVDTSGLRLPTPVGAPGSPHEASLRDVTYELDPPLGGIESLALTRDAQDRLVVRLRLEGQLHPLPLGFGEWLPGVASRLGQPLDTAGAAAWVDESTVVVSIIFLGTPMAWTLTIRLDEARLQIALDLSASAAETHYEAVAMPAST